jgi:hypothetical protein
MAAIASGTLKIEKYQKERVVKRQLSCTWFEVKNEVHTFVVVDKKPFQNN